MCETGNFIAVSWRELRGSETCSWTPQGSKCVSACVSARARPRGWSAVALRPGPASGHVQFPYSYPEIGSFCWKSCHGRSGILLGGWARAASGQRFSCAAEGRSHTDHGHLPSHRSFIQFSHTNTITHQPHTVRVPHLAPAPGPALPSHSYTAAVLTHTWA